MIVLLITYYINHLVNRIVCKAKFSCTDILRHINRCTIATKKQLMIQTFSSQIRPNRSVLFFEKETFFQPFHNLLLPFEISVGFIIYLVEADTHFPVSFIKSGIHPVIHHFPQSAYFRVTGFPLHQHFTSFLHQGRSSFRFRLSFILTHSLCRKLRHKFLYLRFIMPIERYIIIANEVVTFFAGSFRGFTVSIFLPCQHGFTDMDTTIVYDICFYYLITICRHNVSQCVT